MSAIVIGLLGLWGFLVWFALTVARDRLSVEGAVPSWRDRFLARGAGFLAASLILLVFSRLMALLRTSDVTSWPILAAWVLSVFPLAVPAGSEGARLRPSTQGLILASVALTVASVFGLALYLLIRLIQTSPELL